MCVVSFMGDHYNDKWKEKYPWPQTIPGTIQPLGPLVPNPVQPYTSPNEDILSKLFQREITRQEFDDLKKEVEEMKKILTLAAEYDKRNNEPHCEMEQKVDLLKKMAGLFGISLDDVFGKPKEEKII